MVGAVVAIHMQAVRVFSLCNYNVDIAKFVRFDFFTHIKKTLKMDSICQEDTGFEFNRLNADFINS